MWNAGKGGTLAGRASSDQRVEGGGIEEEESAVEALE